MPKSGARSKKASVSGANGEENLIFEPDTISSLTKKIEANLKNKQNGKRPSKRKEDPGIGRRTKDQKKSGLGSKPMDRQDAEPAHNERNGTMKSNSIPQGTKRLRDGQVKDTIDAKPRVNGVPKEQNGHKKAPEEHSRLEQEILALGGSKDDLKLIEDAASDSELEDDNTGSKKPPSKGLKKELLRLVQELGIEKTAQDVDESVDANFDEDEPTVQANGSKILEPPRKDADALRAKTSKLGASDYPKQVEPTSEWHAITLPPLASPNSKAVALPPDLIHRVHEYAKTLLDTENERYASQTGSANSAQQFYSTIMSSGTLSDKISALTLSAQESPLHNVRALETLVGLARKRSRGQAVEVLGALKDLFGIGSVLPPNRKLRAFATQPDLLAAFVSRMRWMPDEALPKNLTRAHLIVWAFEDWLKTTYFEILKILETWCNDEVVFARGKAVDYVCQLLKEKPEQEANLLRLLVNKLGDKDKKIASKTSYHILQLETAHPLMKPTIISAIESDLLFRPGQSLHAQYYAVITLNQTILSGKEEDVAKKLLNIYFSLFARLLAKPQPTKPTLSKVNTTRINQKGEIQGGGGPAGKAARRKAELKEKATTVEDDLREKMLSAVLTGVNRAVPYANTSDEVFEKHMDTLFRVTHSSNFNTSIQALMLIQQLNETRQGSIDRFYRTLYESLLDPRLLTSSKQALYLNLLFKSLRSDLNIKRVKAFAKRLLQVVSMHQPAFACGAMYMLRELEGIFASLSSFVDDREQDDNDEEEVFHDVEENDTGQFSPHNRLNSTTTPQTTPGKKETYEPRKRNPEHSNADNSCLWEILPFLTHYHPSVSLFAAKLIAHAPMPPKPDLQSHTLIHFLDRFVYRNPNTTTSARGASIMQPLSSASAGNNLLVSSAPSFRNRTAQPVNTEAFWKQEADKVEADEVFFHKYFSAVGKGREKVRKQREKKKKRKGDDEGSDDEDEGEEEIWKALVGSRPEIEGSDAGSDEGFDDVDESEDESVFGDGEEDEEAGGKVENVGRESDDEEMPDFGEDDDALLASDDDVPSDLDTAFEKEAQATKRTKPEVKTSKERNKERKQKRMKLKQLPTFADADEYAKMLEGEEGEDEDGL